LHIFITFEEMIIKRDFCLKAYNTFGIKVMARKCAQITSTDQLLELYKANEFNNQDVLIIGEGSNILLQSHFEGLVLMNLMRGKKVVSENDKEVLIEVNAGEYWTTFVDYTVENEWWGIENLSLIPGKLGAAPVQNIGAYGTEQKDVFVKLQAFDMQEGKFVEFSKDECQFGYRDSIFKNKYKKRFLILNVTYKLSKSAKPNLSYKALANAFKGRNIEEISIVEIQNTINGIRESKLPDPQKINNAGSFFKNPIVHKATALNLKEKYPDIPIYEISDTETKLAAGWLIEKCNWKGKRIGDAAVHEKQALVLVNHGNATGKEIYELSEEIKMSVEKLFSVSLEREVLVF